MPPDALLPFLISPTLALSTQVKVGVLIFGVLSVVFGLWFVRTRTLTDASIQATVHKLEEGGWASWIRRAVLIAAIAYVINLWMFKESGFKGLGHEKAIEQAEIAREIARGNGFSTKMIRPAALWQFQSNKGAFPKDIVPDTYHAPLNPYISSIFLRMVKGDWAMTTKDVVYICDKILASIQLFFFLMAVLVSYFTAKRLFDKRLAVFGVGMVLLCERMWDYAMSGLPQMLMLFLFSSAMYVTVRAIEAKQAGKSTLLWSAGIGALFGLLALSHAMTLFMFAGLLIFAVFFFRPWGRDAAIILAVCALFYGPWLVRNHQVCGDFAGVGWYSGLTGIRGPESQVMRTMALEGPLTGVIPTAFHEKLRGQVIQQFGDIYHLLGSILVAPIFFLALLHLFKKPDTAVFRWCILSMWSVGVFGMCLFGLEPSVAGINPVDVQAADLHILFVPLMTFYGLALVLVMWSRLEINIKFVRIGFIVLIFTVSAGPFLSQFIELQSRPKNRVQWPPYVPPYVAVLSEWTRPNEMLMSDMPWAVAWYADRKCLWLPMTIEDFISLNDYNRLGGNIVGMYLTPVSGNAGFLKDIAKGEYKDWAPFILRQVNIKDFPLRAVTALPIENECVFYADRDRWTARED